MNPNPAGRTQTRLHPSRSAHIAPQMLWSQQTSCEKKLCFALTTVSSPLPDCDAYNPLCRYISIHVRLFLSLADWKNLLNPLIIPALKVYLLLRRQMTNATLPVFFHLESTSTVMFTLLNYNNDLLVVIKTRSKFFFSKKRTELEVRYALLHTFFSPTSLMKRSMITVRLQAATLTPPALCFWPLR